jgi:NIMA (never in mitosis gene a)-related kinase 1/4/5
LIKFVGDGSYSSVYRVKRLEDGLDYALKKVKIESLSVREKENALNEVRILASIRNPFVAGYKQAFFDEASSSLW